VEQQFVVTHKTRQAEIPVLVDSWITNTLSDKLLSPKKIASPFIFVKI
jgi:hypothetical protein